MRMRWMLPEVLEGMGWTAYRLHQESVGTLSLRRWYELADPKRPAPYVNGDIMAEICATTGCQPNDLWRFERDLQGVSVSPRDTVCAAHSGLAWDYDGEGNWVSGEHCPKCCSERRAKLVTK